jgi:hypothetical protein
MNYQDLKSAKETFPLHRYEKKHKELEAVRLAFVHRFSKQALADMIIDDFIEGKGNPNTFCYMLEYKLDGLGRISGRYVNKFGLWYSSEHQEYHFNPKYGKTYEEAFDNIKSNIIKILEDGAKVDIKALIDNPIDSWIKGKILSTYFPDRFLNIFSSQHLDHYLRSLDLDTKDLMKSDAILKREALLAFKNSDPDMKNWSINMFAVFLYSHYPKEPLKENEVAVKSKDKEPEFPSVGNIEWVTQLIDSKQSQSAGSLTKSPKGKSPDYEEESKRHKKLGDRGEHIVHLAEVERVQKELGVDRETAEEYIDWRSRKGDDACGYDIKSVNADGSPRYIEVKATQGKVGDTSFYYTENELQRAKEYGDSYCIYMVYDIITKNPKIWNMGNPFRGDGILKLQPIKYRVAVKTTKD